MVKTIVHHLGLGDQIMLNGMVRHFAETDTVAIIVKRCHEESVRFMYRDISDRVELILVDTTNPQVIWSKVKGDVIALATYGIDDNGWTFMTQGQGSVMTNWAHGVYIQAGINPKYMYSKFKVDRDTSKEFKIDNENYIFVHDDPERDRVIDVKTDKFIYKPQSKVIDNNQEFFKCERPNIFEYLGVIENADEVHCMNSSYNWMIELMNIGNPKKNFFHLDVAHKYYVPKTVKTVFSDEVWTFI
jgi:hypothetical protein